MHFLSLTFLLRFESTKCHTLIGLPNRIQLQYVQDPLSYPHFHGLDVYLYYTRQVLINKQNLTPVADGKVLPAVICKTETVLISTCRQRFAR